MATTPSAEDRDSVRGLTPWLLRHLRCPQCGAELHQEPLHFICKNETCRSDYPLVNGTPILIPPASTLFAIEQYTAGHHRTASYVSFLKQRLMSHVPSIGHNLKAATNYRNMRDLLDGKEIPRVLIVGGRVVGEGMSEFLETPGIEFVETDIDFGPRTAIVCDAHLLPFANESFDGVVIQAVLEHVADPFQCVAELHRVLRPNGLVYAEIPFMQQVHASPYDFTRFTYVGMRRLFRAFEEIEMGAPAGPGMALAWSYYYFLLSFTRPGVIRSLVAVLAQLTGFWIKYFDKILLDKPGAMTAASGYYFLGKKSSVALTDRQIVTRFETGK